MTVSAPKFCVYCKPEDVNDATFRYIEIIRRGLRQAGRTDLGITYSDTILKQADEVVSISCLPAARVLLKHPRARLFHWFQGIEAVERRYLHGGVKGWLRYWLWSVLEAIVLRRATLKFFVSEEMRTYLRDARFDGRKSIVIPCYNADFDTEAWSQPGRYSRMDLVYAGSLYKWQCVEDVVMTFKQLRAEHQNATLTLFTREEERARALCLAHGLDDVHIQAVTPSNLVPALRQFSYGFILRDDIDINRVSTPTKLSTYMAAGVIPVLTHATPALSRILEETPYKVLVTRPSAHQEAAQKINELTANAPSIEAIRESYTKVFQHHFADSVYADRISTALNSI